MTKFEQIAVLAENLSASVFFDEPLSKHTTFKIGGKAKLFLIIYSKEALSKIIVLCNKLKVKYLALGNGSNILASDHGFDGVIFTLDGEFKEIKLMDGTTILCGSAVPLKKLCIFAYENALTGLEFAYGIPGLAGGAAFMNAGAYDGEMKDVLAACYHIDQNGNEGMFKKEELNLSYRRSVYSDNKFTITDLVVRLTPGGKPEIKAKMDDFLNRRKTKQPLEYPSAGSVFKRPDGYYAGALIEKCGLKGKCVGGAMVSEKHAGFIINKGNATSEDVEYLIKEIKDSVEKECGITLECEIKSI